MLGWRDTPIPTSLAFAWLIGLGVLLAASVLDDDRRLLAAAGLIVVTGIIASWVLEMAQGDPSGTYWQGRYYLPFLVGILRILREDNRHAAYAVNQRLRLPVSHPSGGAADSIELLSLTRGCAQDHEAK